jgi:hypothetical protein
MSTISLDVQVALVEFRQVEVLLEMMIDYFAKSHEFTSEWYEKLESAIYLLEETYKTKNAALVLALKGDTGNV